MKTYSKEYILERVGPCGLHCGKCFAFSKGDIRKLSRELKLSLGNFEAYAKRFVELLDAPVFENYPQFKIMLDHFSDTECKGCRKESCKLFVNCRVRECSQEKGVELCYQCAEFPCNNTGFDEHLTRRWMDINRKIEKIGIEKYYEEIKDQARY